MSFGGPVAMLHSVKPVTKSPAVQAAPVHIAQLAPCATTPRAMRPFSEAIRSRVQLGADSSQ